MTQSLGSFAKDFLPGPVESAIKKSGIPKEAISISVDKITSQQGHKQVFELPDSEIDISSLKVVVQKSTTETEQTVYTLATDATEVLSTSTVYYIEEADSGKYRIYFGDDIFGKKLSDGNLVAVSYIVSSGALANGLNTFKLGTQLLTGSTSNTSLVIKSSGGSPRELIDDIKFAAPKSFISNNRAVTRNDYITLINKKYPYFDAINVWGGEDEEPPVYGKVFIALKPKIGYEVSDVEKSYLINQIIKPFSVLTVTPEFVDVNYDYVNIIADVQYDPSLTNKTPTQIQGIVRSAIASFADDTLNTFTSTFKLSRLLQYIDNSDTAISSSTADVFIEKRFSPILGSSENYTLEFGCELRRGASSKDKLYSTPSFTQKDATGITRNVFFEETPQSFSGIESVEIISPGTNYTKTPTVTVDGDGQGATLEAVIVNGKLKAVNVVTPGVNYTTAVLTITPASGDFSGSGAIVKAIIQGRTGILRTYYFDDTSAKRILNPNAGTINYINGTISIINFAPDGVADELEQIKILAKPNTLDFKSSKSTILTLDPYESTSIAVNVRAI